MADITLSAVNPISPAPQKSGQEAANAEQASDQPSFASVLRERSSAQTEQKQAGERAENAAPTAQEATPEAAAAQAEAPVDVILASLTASSGLADAGQAALASSEDSKATGEGQLIDPNLLASPATPLAVPLNLPVAPAAPAANLAAQAAAADTGSGNDAFAQAGYQLSTTERAEASVVASTADAALDAESKAALTTTTTSDSSFSDALTAAQRASTSQITQQVSGAPLNQAQHTSEVPQQVVRTPVGTPGWAEEVGQRVSWVARGDNGRADLVLTPPQMGRVEVSINMNGDQATASFIAASPAAREAIQDAMPRLREMLAQAGINLAQADVSAGQQGQAQANQQNGQGRGNSSPYARMMGGTGEEIAAPAGQPVRIQSGRGMVDIFA